MRGRLRLGFGFLILSLLPTAGFSYIPPSEFILRSWLKKNSGSKSFKVKINITAYQEGKATEDQFTEIAVFHPQKQIFWSRAIHGKEHEIFSVEKKFSSLSLVSLLFSGASFLQVAQELKSKGIPIQLEEELLKMRTEVDRRASETQFLARFGESLAWVIGAADENETLHPQLWFKKDLFFPIRLVYKPLNHEWVDFRFDQYSFLRDFPYPKTITLTQKGKGIVLVAQVVEVDSNAEVHPLFSRSLEKIDSRATSGVQSLVRFYYEVFR